jgi:hypothetical protein
VLELARQLVGDRDLEPTLDLFRRLLEATPYASLIARRRELLERGSAPRGLGGADRLEHHHG